LTNSFRHCPPRRDFLREKKGEKEKTPSAEDEKNLFFALFVELRIYIIVWKKLWILWKSPCF